MEDRYFEDYVIGERQVTGGRTVSEADIRLFIGCTDNTAPVHVDGDFCKSHPAVTGCVAQGVMVLGMADGFMAREVLSPRVPVLHYGHEKVRYVRPVYPGDTIHCELDLIDKQEKNSEFGIVSWKVNVLNQHGETVIVHIDKQYVGRRKGKTTENRS